MLQDPAPIADVKASPYLNYIPTVPDASVNVISLLSAEAINTPLDILGGQTIREWFPTSDFCTKTLGLPSGTPYPEGINKTVRRALSYAYDYNGFLAATYPETSGGGVYCWSPWGMSSPYTNESAVSHPGPEPDLTKARTILLNDPYYNGLATARGLSLANTTDDWVSVAKSNPMHTFTFLIYPGSTTTPFLREACEALGFALDVHEDADVAGELWTKFVATGRACMYDMFSYVYLMDPLDPARYGVYNELADILINKEVHSLYESQGYMGMVLNAGFHYASWAKEIGGPAGPGISIAGIGGSRMKATTLPPAIPGFPIVPMLLIMITAITSIIHVIIRKGKEI
ncbi:MAG: hypothetical protein ACTSSM_15660 [Promethearchaeota archaeon]